MASTIFYLQAHDELEQGDRDTGLWAKSIVQANGCEDKAKAIYIKKRARQIACSVEERGFIERIAFAVGRALRMVLGRK